MGAAVGWGRIGRRLAPAAVAAVAAAAWAGGAHAQLSEAICNPLTPTAVASYPSADELMQAAKRTEARLARRGGGDVLGDLSQLEVAADGATAPSPAAAAEYCAAAGEIMRVSPQGSQLQAQAYLLGAFQKATTANLPETASLAAYRLGLVSLSGQTVAGSRGGGRSRGGATAAVQSAAQVATEGEGPCRMLRSPALLSNPNLTVSLAALSCSAEQARQAGDFRTAALASLRLARLRLTVAESDLRRAEDFRLAAFADAVEGLDDARKVEDPAVRVELLGRLAAAVLDSRHAPPFLAETVAAMRAAQPGDPNAEAFAAALEGRLALVAGDRAAARAHLTQALLYEAQRPLPTRLPAWRLLMAEADPANREAHVLSAYRGLESLRPLLPRFDPLTEETAFSLYMRQVFQSAVDVQLAGAEGAVAPIRVKDAQQIVEAYRQAELQSVFGSECIPQRDPVRPETLAADEVLLYPILLPDRIELLYVTGAQGEGAAFKRLPPNTRVDRQAVGRIVEQMVLSLSYDEDDNWKAAARQLYDLLIKPIEGELKPGSMLAVVPDGALRGVPFGALIDGDGKYLIQKTRVAVAPSLAYSQPAGGEAADERMNLVAASLEREVRLPAGFFEKLDGTADEVKVAAVADGERIQRARMIENFKKADLVSALSRERVDMLHLATHASFNGRSDRAFIVADGEAILLSELRNLLATNRARGEELDLLILSACETAVGDDEASMGLAGAAVQAGAKSAIASLWPVNDAGTLELMKQFYANYRDGESKSAALRDAQMTLISAGGANANPNVWAAFTLLGAWR